MTPTETLAAARLSPVGPYVTPRPEWLEGWCGPVEWLDTFRDPAGRWVVSAYGAGGMANGAPAERIRLDLRRPEVRDRLVRCGCPARARDCAPAVWCWGMGLLAGLYGPWRGVEWAANLEMRVAMHIDGKRAGPMVAEFDAIGLGAGWCVQPDLDPWTPADGAHGPETGADGRACADLAALRAGCVLEEADGWYVPGDTIGWWPKNLETP